MNQHTTHGIRAALAAGKMLRMKDGSGSLDPILRAIEDNNRAVEERLKGIETKQQESGQAVGGAIEHLREIEQKMARGGGYDGPARPESWGEKFLSSPEVKSLLENPAGRPTRFSTSTSFKSTVTSATGSGGDLVVPTRDTTVMLPQRKLRMRDILPTINVTTGSVEYPRQTTRTNNAATVAEAATKPESAYGFELQTAPIRTIAHWIPASRQVLDDAPQLRGLIDSELMFGLKEKEETQILNGDGTGQNLLGLIPQATAYSAPFAVTGGTMIDTIGLALLQASLAGYPPDGIVMHEADWLRIVLTKDAGGYYVIGDPQARTVPSLFGVPVVTTQSIAVDKFLVGNFQAAATLYDRWQARVEVSTEHSDFFVRNLVAILAEERIGLAVKQSGALIFGDFGNV